MIRLGEKVWSGREAREELMDIDAKKLLEEAWNVPLLEAIFTRRSRRFGLGGAPVRVGVRAPRYGLELR